ncbi:MAG: hypothetical protein NUV81_03270 [bacterium]|nr:hypothetical protein [bacterium]
MSPNMNLDTLNRDDLFKEVSDLARDQGVMDQEMWKEITDEVVDSHLDLGELDPDQNLVALKEILYGAWDEYVREAGVESEGIVQDEPPIHTSFDR